MKKIAIVNYGINNIKSIFNAVNQIGYNPIVIENSIDIKNFSCLILPGVGAFDKGVNNLKSNGIYDQIIEFKNSKKPLLGICLGMQMLFEKSHEFGMHLGFGFIDGSVKKIMKKNKLQKIPSIGWFSLVNKKEINPFGIKPNEKFYFIHSYEAKASRKENVLYKYDNGYSEITSIVKKDNVTGVQFHPEKSGEVGLKFLKNYFESVI